MNLIYGSLLLLLAISQIAGAVADEKTSEALHLQKRADEFLHMISSGAPGFNRTVKNKPFSADAETETVRVLEDGNRIVRRNSMKQYRDAEGRTRREQTLEALGPSAPVAARRMIFLHDPVKGVDSVVDPEARVVRQIFVSSSAGQGVLQTAPNGQSADIGVEDLGKRSIEGLVCTGTRRTMRIPAGQIGNEAPIAIVTESWFSADIEAVVESTSRDPRLGMTRYKLQRVLRGDPAPGMFLPPGDYKLEMGSRQ